MTQLRRRTAQFLLAAFFIGGSVLLWPGSFAALGPAEGGAWEQTSEAQLRTEDGDCNPGEICLEWCLNGVGTGDFACFNHLPSY